VLVVTATFTPYVPGTKEASESPGNTRMSKAVSPGARSMVGPPGAQPIEGPSEPTGAPVASGKSLTKRGHYAPTAT